MSSRRKVLYAAAAVLVCFGAAEGLLRLTGFRYQRVTTYMEFNYPRPGFLKAFFELDPDLLYRIRPTVKQRYLDLTWQPRFDLKIRDARTFGPKPPGTFRILALGDSSTYGVNTPRPWPQRLQSLLDRRAGPGRFQVINLGVPGYTAFQGRRLLETRGPALEPDAVVIYFGWNDHLLALGHADADQKVGSAAVVGVRNRLGGLRVYQAVSWLVAALRPAPAPDGAAGRERGEGEGPPLRRVGRDSFRQELERMIALAEGLGAQVVLCTYPTAFSVLAARGLAAPDWLAETHLGDAGGLPELLALQEIYNDTVRAVGRERQAPVADLEALFQARGKAALFDAPDGDLIHPADAGYDLVAAAVDSALRSGAVP